MSKEPIFVSLFRESPLKGIEKHVEKCAEAAQELKSYFRAALNKDWDDAFIVYEKITELESDADDIKQEIRSNLPRTLLMPVSRQDLLDLIHLQDKIANTAKDIAGLILGRKMSFPGEISEGLLTLVDHSISAVNLLSDSVHRLQDLTHVGFNDKSLEALGDRLNELRNIEHQSDIEQRHLREVLFGLESELNPIDVVFIYRILDLVGNLADAAESTGNRVLCIAFS